MYFISKLKADRSIAFIVPALSTLGLFFIALAIGGIRLGALVLGVAFLFFAVLAFRSYWRTRNPFIIVQTVYLASVGLYALTVPQPWGRGNTEMARLLALVAGASDGITSVENGVVPRAILTTLPWSRKMISRDSGVFFIQKKRWPDSA